MFSITPALRLSPPEASWTLSLASAGTSSGSDGVSFTMDEDSAPGGLHVDVAATLDGDWDTETVLEGDKYRMA